MKILDARGSRVNKSFTADAVLRKPRHWKTFTPSQFVSHGGFPAVDYDHLPPPDLIVREPVPGGSLVMLLPLETAEHWRSQPGNRRLPPETIFVTAYAGTVSTADLAEILTGASGWMIELETLTAPARALYERKLDHQTTRFTSRGGDIHAN